MIMHKAMLYTRKKGYVQCELCSHHCKIPAGKRGICRVRENRDGELFTLVYGKLVAEHIDPIEKKPLFHVLPGSRSFSISTRGCNFHCLHCQNASISQVGKDDDPARFCEERTPEKMVAAAQESGCRTISYTYVEPTVFFEFAFDCCTLAAEKNIGNIFVSNGYMSEKTSRLLAPVLTAINIDLKSFSDEFYTKVCGAHLQPVLDTVKLMYELGVWVEVTTLLIPGKNDSTEEIQNIAHFLAAIDTSIPWHVTAFYPTYKMLEPIRTPRKTLERARDIGLAAGLKFVYEGNIPGSGGETTYCPDCGIDVVERYGFTIMRNNLSGDRCPQCSAVIAGVWK
jgi:pyruvate formate lyase activating enzyme